MQPTWLQGRQSMQSDDGRVPSPRSPLEDTAEIAVIGSSLSMGAAMTDFQATQLA